MNFMLTCVKCNREIDGSATNADHIRSLCCLCNDQDVVVGDGSSEDNEDVSEDWTVTQKMLQRKMMPMI